MRYSAAGFALLLGCLATTPRLRAQAAEPTSRPAGVSYASVTASRAGFGPAAALAGALVPDTTATGCGSFRRRALHSVLGAGAGLVAGAIGAVVGWQMDRRDHGDAMIPASAALGVIGGAAGLVTGAVAGALVP